MWQPRPVRDPVLYLGIVEQIRSAIRRGDLVPGDRLPTHRALAARLHVTISTVTRAYAEAARLHLVSGEVGRGTFVLAGSADATLFAAMAETADADGSRVDLTANVPAVDPVSTALTDTVRAVAEDGIAEGYPSAELLWRGRIAMEALLARRGVTRRADEIVLTAGAQHALMAALLTTTGPGAKVLAEEMTFPGLKAVARQLHIELIPVHVDDQGLVPEDLARQAQRTAARVLVCVPTLQNPTGATMGRDRRAAIADVVKDRDLRVIEDDAYGALADEPCLAGVLPDHALVVTGLAKTVEPGLRIGAVAGPPHLTGTLAEEAHMTSWELSSLSIEVFTRWSADGTVERRTAWQRAEVLRRWRIADQALGRSDLHPAPHRFISLTRSAERIAREAAAAGVHVVPSTVLGVGPKPPKGLRVSLTAAPSAAVLASALARLMTVVGSRKAQPEPGSVRDPGP